MLVMTNVRKTFNKGTISERKALNGIDLTPNDKGFVVVTEGNGAGKPTTLSMIAGIYPIDSRRTKIDDMDISGQPEYKWARYVGQVSWDPMKGTAAGMEMQENMALTFRRSQKKGLEWGVRANEEDYYHNLLTRPGLDLQNHISSKVGLLSDGQKQALILLVAIL